MPLLPWTDGPWSDARLDENLPIGAASVRFFYGGLAQVDPADPLAGAREQPPSRTVDCILRLW